MKTIHILICVALILLNCQDSKDNNEAQTIHKYERSVGQQIPLQVAERWVNNLRALSASRQENTFTISASNLTKLFDNNAEVLGVVLHHATDDVGKYHLLIKVIDSSVLLWRNSPVIDSNVDAPLTADVARAWASRYTESHHDDVLYHFFGADIFDQIRANPLFDHIEIKHAINDQSEPQVLLYVWNESKTSTGRSKAEPVVYDKSFPCPPCADIN